MISENISSFETHWNKFFKDWEEDNKGVFEKDEIWSGERKGSGKNKLEFDVFPQPYLGDFKNHSVITLNLNPSRSKNKPKQLEEFKKTKLEDFKKADNYYEYAKSFPTKELQFWQNQIKWIDGIFKNLKKNISSDVYPFAIEICPWCSESWQTLKMDDEIIQHLDTNVFRVIEQVIENSELKLVLSVGKAYYDIFNYDKKNFKKIDEITSKPFEDFRNNRLTIAKRLAEKYYGTTTYPVDPETGYPVGFGKTSQDVLLPAFLSAYKGSSPEKESTSIFRDIPIPNWDLKYTGLMKFPWFKKYFKRFSLQHGYRSGYTVNQFRTNLDFDINNPEDTDQSGNFKSKTLLTNVNLVEQFSPLIRIDFEMKNSINILFELKKDRALSLSFANNLLTEIQGNEIVIGAGYRIKDLRIGTNFGGKKQILKSDLNFKLDLSRRDNKTIIRYLDIANNQVE